MKLSAPPPPPPEPSGPGSNPEPQPEGKGPETVDTQAGEAAATPAPVEKPEPGPARWPEWFAGADVILALFAVALAFLVASFAARNSDLWVHLGVGRMLTTGEYRLGSDPLSYTGADRPWVNHSWLFDLGAFLLYSGDGFTLVLAKALVVAAAFALLLAIRRPGQPLWPWAAVAAVAALAAAPRLTLHPIVGSVFFLSVTLFLLFRVPSPPGSWRLPAAVGVTFWLWSNVDVWFLLGPCTLGLLLIGELIRAKVSKAAGPDTTGDPLGSLPDTATLARALLIGVVVCMLNPHHVRVWQIPIELTGMGGGTESDSRIRYYFISPLSTDYRTNAGLGWNFSGLMYAVLLGMGLYAVSLSGAVGRFLGPPLDVDPLPLPHTLLWCGLAALSLASMYAIPFLAVATVPLVASRFNALSGRVVLGSWTQPRTRWVLVGSAVGRVVSLLGLLTLCVLAWPGWLHTPVANPVFARRVAWSVEPEPSLVAAATQLQKWRDGGELTADDRGLIASLELANYCAWFAPQEKVFLNSRFQHHRVDMPEFLQVRQGLGLIRAEDLPDPQVATSVFDKYRVNYVGLSRTSGDSEFVRSSTQLANQRMWVDPDHWSPWYLNGHATVTGWRETALKQRPSFDRLRIDPALLAFGPEVAVARPGKVEPVPPPRTVVDDFTRPLRPGSADAEEALEWLQYKQVLVQRRDAKRETLRFLQIFMLRNVPQFSKLPIAADVAGMNVDKRSLAAAEALWNAPQPDQGAMLAIPILAVKAARRAIEANPDHPDGYWALARAIADSGLPISESERTIGRVTALRQCLSRLPAAGKFHRNVYVASPTQVAWELAQLYLNLAPNTADYFRGAVMDLPAIGELIGTVIVGQPNSRQVRRLPLISPRPADSQVLGGPYVLPLDLAHQALKLASEYVPVEYGTLNSDEFQRLSKRLEEERKRVEKLLQSVTNQYRNENERRPKVKERFQAALYLGLAGEALDLVKSVDMAKEFGPEAPRAALQIVALKLAVGQLEDAASDIASLKEAFDTSSGPVNPQIRDMFQYLEFRKLDLEGDYKGAGAEWERLAGPGVGAPLPPEFQKLKPRLFVAYGPAWPAATLLGAIDGPFGVLGRFALGQIKFVEFQQMRAQINAKMNHEVDFFFRRGFLSLLEGDIPSAAERFRNCPRTAPPGWGLRDLNLPAAPEYLRAIEGARKRAAAAP